MATGPDLREHVDQLFVARSVGAAPLRTGVEVELIPVIGRPPRPAALSETHGAVLRHDPALLLDACVSFEPGGQVELSPPPQDSPRAVLDALDGLIARLDGALRREGIVAVSSGLNPWHTTREVARQLDAERYAAMERHFDGIGESGRRMMRLTAGLQVCVDLRPGDEGVEQWLLANRMGPALSAVFANSAVGGGMVTGWSGSRCLLWQKLDASRTGFDGAQVAAVDPAGAYARFAGDAIPIPLARGGGVEHHLSTLFPPVRPRGYLEVRYLDAPPRRWMALPLLVVDTLLREPRARRAALDALGVADRGTLLSLWEAAAHQGVVNPWLRSEALALFGISLDALARLPRDAVPRGADSMLRAFRDGYPCIRRCWSDDQVERINGPDAEDPTAWT